MIDVILACGFTPISTTGYVVLSVLVFTPMIVVLIANLWLLFKERFIN